MVRCFGQGYEDVVNHVLAAAPFAAEFRDVIDSKMSSRWNNTKPENVERREGAKIGKTTSKSTST